MSLSPLDELRALPPPLARATLARIAAEHGPAAVAALRWQVEAHRRPAQRWVELDELCDDGLPWRVLVITGEYGSGKTQLATWLTLRAIVEWRVERPRVIAANDDTIRDDLVKPDAPSGLLAWLPPWIPRDYSPSAQGRGGRLSIDGIEVSMVSAKAGANAVGSACGWCMFDDFAKVCLTNGQESAEDALKAAFRSLRSSPGKMVLPTTPEGADMVLDLASGEGFRGVVRLDLGKTEDNRALPPAAYDFARGARKMGFWTQGGEGLFSGFEWRPHRVADCPPLVEIAVSIDPAKSSRSKSCEVGIMGGGRDERDVIHVRADRSEVLSADDWPRVAHDLLEELQAEHPRAASRFIVENNAGGDSPAALLRAEEKIRRLRRGKPGVSMIEVREVTARRNDGKARRGSPVLSLARGGQVKHARGLGVVEQQLAHLVDEGTGTDRADAEVWLVRDLAGIGESDERAAKSEARATRTRDQFAHLEAAQSAFASPAVAGWDERA